MTASKRTRMRRAACARTDVAVAESLIGRAASFLAYHLVAAIRRRGL